MHLLRIFQLRNVIIWLSQQWHVLSSSTCLWWLNVSEGIGRPAKRRATLNEDCLFRSQEAEEANIPEGSRMALSVKAGSKVCTVVRLMLAHQ